MKSKTKSASKSKARQEAAQAQRIKSKSKSERVIAGKFEVVPKYPFDLKRADTRIPTIEERAIIDRLPHYFSGIVGYLQLKSNLLKLGYLANDLEICEFSDIIKIVTREFLSWGAIKRQIRESFNRRNPDNEATKKVNEQVKQEHFQASCVKCRQLLANAEVRAYWLAQARTVIETEKTWQGPDGASFRYEWPRDKAKVYAVMAIAADTYSGIKILPDKLRQTEFYNVNKHIDFHIAEFDLAAEFLSYIEADLREQGIWPIEASGEKIANPKQNDIYLIQTESQLKILKYLNEVKIAVAHIDIEIRTGLAKNTVSEEIKFLKKNDFVSNPVGKKRRVIITPKGINYLNPSK